MREYLQIEETRISKSGTETDSKSAAQMADEMMEEYGDGWNPLDDRIWDDELDAMECEDEYLIENILVAGQLCVIAGPEKCLKTSIMVDMAVSVGYGTEFLNRYRVFEPGRVGIVSCESGLASLKNIQRRIVDSRDIPALRKRIAYHTEALDLQKSDHIDNLRNWILCDGLSVVMLDPANMLLPRVGSNASNTFVMGPVMKSLSKVANQTGCSIVVAHHFHKLSPDKVVATPDLSMTSQSGWREGARQWILLNRREMFNPEKPGVHKLWMVAGGSAGHCEGLSLDVDEGRIRDGRKWEVESRTISNEKLEYQKRKAESKESENLEKDRRVIDALTGYPNGRSQSALLREVKGDISTLKESLERLQSTGEVERFRGKSGGQKCDLYRIVV